MQKKIKKQKGYLDQSMADLRKQLSAMEDGLLKINTKKELFLKDLHEDHQDVKERAENNTDEIKKILTILLDQKDRNQTGK